MSNTVLHNSIHLIGSSRNFREGRFLFKYKGKFKRVPADARHDRFKVGCSLMIWNNWAGVPYQTNFACGMEMP